MFACRLTAVNLVSFPQPLSMFAVQFLNAVGDLLDLIPALVPGSSPPLRDFKLPGMGHCSALIKVRGHTFINGSSSPEGQYQRCDVDGEITYF